VNELSKKRDLARCLGRTLLGWSFSSLVVGLLLYLFSTPLLRGIGLQAILWGFIDVVIASFTLFKQQDNPASKLARILLINVGLDVGYQAVGVILIVFLGQDPFIAGNGIGVIIQGAFLFFLDFYFYQKMKRLVSTEEKE